MSECKSGKCNLSNKMKINGHPLTDHQQEFLEVLQDYREDEVTKEDFITTWGKFTKGRTWLLNKNLKDNPAPEFNKNSYIDFLAEYNLAMLELNKYRLDTDTKKYSYI